MREIASSDGQNSKLVYVSQSDHFEDMPAIPKYVHLSDNHSEIARVAFRELATLLRDDTWGSLEDDELQRIIFEKVVPEKAFITTMRHAANRAIGKFNKQALPASFEPLLVKSLSDWELLDMQTNLQLTDFELNDWADSCFWARYAKQEPPQSRITDALEALLENQELEVSS